MGAIGGETRTVAVTVIGRGRYCPVLRLRDMLLELLANLAGAL